MVGQNKWLRNFIRRRMMPVPEDTARKWKTRLSLGYMFIAWNAVGAFAYAAYTGKLDWADYYGLKSEEDKRTKSNEYYARNIGRAGSTKLITMKGLTQIESKEFDFENEVLKKQMAVPEEELSPAQKVMRRQQQLKKLEEKLEQLQQNPQSV